MNVIIMVLLSSGNCVRVQIIMVFYSLHLQNNPFHSSQIFIIEKDAIVMSTICQKIDIWNTCTEAVTSRESYLITALFRGMPCSRNSEAV